ncbi:MAG: hypothetical protein L6Q72_00410 [Burkholderiaceae bacterium]|jgi:hypothetical protein|nr:hypothetical protein [Burkholderiaceae bacterium]
MRSIIAAFVSAFFNSTFFASGLPVERFSIRPDAGLPLATFIAADFLDAADFFVTIGSPVFVAIRWAAVAARVLDRLFT